MVSRSQTYVLELNGLWEGAFATEPYECAWSRGGIVFIRPLAAKGMTPAASARVQISPDGIHWSDEGASVRIGAKEEQTFARLSHFGGWLRLAGQLPPGAQVKVMCYIAVKE